MLILPAISQNQVCAEMLQRSTVDHLVMWEQT
jgi:hypothetical protein